MEDLDTFLTTQSPTALRPLLGLTILLVEDSLTACEAIRLMCLRSGARIRRADCLESARRHLATYRPSMMITDMSLPDGSGADLISEATLSDQGIDLVLGLSADPEQQIIAEQAGAHGFIEKPIASIAQFQAAVLAHLPASRRPNGPRRVNDAPIAADTVALQEDLAHALNLLNDGDDTPATHTYLATFLSGVAQTASDADLEAVTRAYATARSDAGTPSPEKAKLSAVLIDRLAQKIAI